MNPYELIIGAPPSSQDQIRAAAARLRGADDRSVLAMLSGDPTLQGVGQATYESTQQQAQGLGKARAATENRAAQREMENARLVQQKQIADSNDEIQRKQLAATIANQNAIRSQAATSEAGMAAYRDSLTQQAKDALEESKRNHDLQDNQRKETEEQRKAQQKAVEDRFTDTQTRMLSAKLQDEGVTDLEGAIGMADKEVGKYFDPETGTRVKGKTDIPGYGLVENMVPTIMEGQDSKTLRTYLAGVSNRILKARSGSAVTTPEMTRLATELGANLGQGEEQMIQAYVNLRKGLAHTKQGILSGYDPEVQNTFLTRMNGGLPNRKPDAMGAGSTTGKLTTQRGTSVELIP
jgi:hypothetical protein